MESVSTQLETITTFNENEIGEEYYVDEQISAQLNQYVTTTLITRKNITLADINVTTFDNNEFE